MSRHKYIDLIDDKCRFQQASAILATGRELGMKLPEFDLQIAARLLTREAKAGAATVTVNNDIGGLVKVIGHGSTSSNPVESLKTLSEVLAAGLISQDEFDAKKNEKLSRM